ncbi:hypothetical protein ACFC08_37595 [Streptomyces sp. NPDC056112]|uniref:hypothetical protein n=1 Tax=Streptomyces sp. NPDC056112 TaxID=3345715 RepID=UPI0035DCED34
MDGPWLRASFLEFLLGDAFPSEIGGAARARCRRAGFCLPPSTTRGSASTRVIDGTPQEIVEYERLTGGISQAVSAVDAAPSSEETTETAADGETTMFRGSAPLAPADHVALMKFIYGRAGKNDERTVRTERFVMQLLEEEDVVVALGRSSKTSDGLADYLMIRDNGLQRYGAVAYLRPSNGGLTVRLGPDDLEHLERKDNPRLQYRNVTPSDPYKINCPLADEEAFDPALDLGRVSEADLDVSRSTSWGGMI